jgi:oligopeptide/dipeptide ABC transporter ATP-binding protein
MSDRIAVMYLGRIVEIGENNDIFNSPLHPYTQLLLSAVPACNPSKKREKVAIKGDVGEASNHGCNFQNRCLYVLPCCREQEPLLTEIENKRFCACHLAGTERFPR